MLTAILIVLVVLTLAVFRVNQYLRLIAKNQVVINNQIQNQTRVIQKGQR